MQIEVTKKGHYSGRGAETAFSPGTFDTVSGLEDSQGNWRKPAEGKTWILSYNRDYLEVDTAALKDADYSQDPKDFHERR